MQRFRLMSTWFGVLVSWGGLTAIFILSYGPPKKGSYTDNAVIPTQKTFNKVGVFGANRVNRESGVMPSQNTFSKVEAFVDDRLGNNKEGSPPQTISCQTNCDQTSLLSTIGEMPGWTERILFNNISKYNNNFRPRLTQVEYDQTIGLYDLIHQIFQQHNLTYFLYGGALLGAYRHFGLVPWDDDIDVMMNGSQLIFIQTVLSRVPGYTFVKSPDQQWKFFKAFTRKPPVHEMWPSIDLFFFAENSTHIWDSDPKYTSFFCYHKTDIFPLTTMLFENSLAPVPRHTKTFLTTNYNIERCVTSSLSHKFHSKTIYNWTETPCRELFPYFPFVFRVCESGFSSEILVKNNQSLLTVKLKC